MNLTEQTGRKAGKDMTVTTEKTGQNEVAHEQKEGMSMAVSVGKTGHNEFTQVMGDGAIIVWYHRTAIIVTDPGLKTIVVYNGGWFTPSTTTHINRSLRRLCEEVNWIPYFAVSNRGGRLQIVSSDPPAHVSLDETRLEVRFGGHA